MAPTASTSKHTSRSLDPSQDDSNSSSDASTTARKVHVRTDRAAAAWRLCHTVWEGVVEAAWNVGNNTLELLPAWARPHSSKGQPYPEDLTGKVALVTGGNAGIGFATAQQLARRGAHVVLACRDSGRAQQAAEEICRTPLLALPGHSLPSTTPSSPSAPSSAAPLCSCESLPVPLDLSRLSSVRAFARCWSERGLPLHLLVCNAGVMGPPKRRDSADGHELQFQVNFLSHWLLVHLLLEHERGRRAKGNEHHHQQQEQKHVQARGRGKPAPWAEAGARAGAKPATGGGSGGACGGPTGPADCTRVVVVSSVVHRAGPLQWHDMLSRDSYEPFITYGVSKLANLMMAKELQRRFDRHPEYGHCDTAVALHPGMVRTALAAGFFKGYGGGWLQGTPLRPLVAAWNAFIDGAGQALLATTDLASRAMLHACLAPREEVAGRYLALGRPARPDAAAEDPALRSELWDYAASLTGCQGLPPHHE